MDFAGHFDVGATYAERGFKARKRAGYLCETGRFLLIFSSMLNSYRLNSRQKEV